MSQPAPAMFSVSSYPRPRTGAFLFSFATQALGCVLLAAAGAILPDVLPSRQYQVVSLLAPPPPVNHEPQVVLREFLRAPTVPVHTPKLELPQREVDPEPPKVAISAPARMPVIEPTQPGARMTPPIQTNVFSTGSSAPQTVHLDARRVQTGGFGDPKGVAANSNSSGRPDIAKVGSFDLPSGEGKGNGTGGGRGVRGVVASAGFGNGSAMPGTRSESPGHGPTGSAGFADANQPAPVQPHPAAKVSSETAPLEILWKPKPQYTDEARKLGIQGEVLLLVAFCASGDIWVVRVIRGLGHGLDDSAIQAAQQIRFKPALRDGAPVNSTAVVHIVFELA